MIDIQQELIIQYSSSPSNFFCTAEMKTWIISRDQTGSDGSELFYFTPSCHCLCTNNPEFVLQIQRERMREDPILNDSVLLMHTSHGSDNSAQGTFSSFQLPFAF